MLKFYETKIKIFLSLPTSVKLIPVYRETIIMYAFKRFHLIINFTTMVYLTKKKTILYITSYFGLRFLTYRLHVRFMSLIFCKIRTMKTISSKYCINFLLTYYIPFVRARITFIEIFSKYFTKTFVVCRKKKKKK